MKRANDPAFFPMVQIIPPSSQ
jgi:predicted protein tyrosine phosphatase